MSNILMIEDPSEEDELLLQDSDFPDNYRHMAHIDDYKITQNYIKSDPIFNFKKHHNRLIFRISFNLNNGYTSISFICDTGAPSALYLSTAARNILSSRIKEDELQNKIIIINNKKYNVEETPSNHRPANIIGLFLLKDLGLRLNSSSFSFDNCPEYF